MAVPKCAIPNCNNAYHQKCAGCGEVYCIRHIAWRMWGIPMGWYCVECAREGYETNRSRLLLWVFLFLVSLLALGVAWFFGTILTQEARSIVVVATVLTIFQYFGMAGVIVGAIIIIVRLTLYPFYSSFYFRNFR